MITVNGNNWATGIATCYGWFELIFCYVLTFVANALGVNRPCLELHAVQTKSCQNKRSYNIEIFTFCWQL